MALDLGIVILTLVIGALVAVLVWSLTKKSTSSTKGKSEKNVGSKKNGKKSSGAQSKPAKKKAAIIVSRDSKSKFTHSWLLTSLKGHTGAITDMDFSANGKHLATCSEDEVFVSQPSTMVETPTPSETDSGCVLSRRQKRNRMKKTQAGSKKKEHLMKTVEHKQRMRRATPLKYYTRLQMKNSEIYSFLYQYVLLDDQLLNLGYPVESSFYPNRAIIYKTPEANVTYYRSDVRRAFRHQPEIIEMAEYLYSSEHNDPYEEKPPISPSLEKRCVRCKKGFFVTLDGEYLTEERCTYHWGQWKRPCSPGESHGYTCCPGNEGSIGCTSGDLHVWNGVSPGMNGPFTDYVRTKPATDPKSHSIYALDCEMCYTGRGLEVCKVSVISIDGCLVYEALVKPHHRVIDYNTRFSGLCEQDLKKATKTLCDVQRDLLCFIHSQTILIGHGLENDLRALRILHSVIIDTAVLFPHYFGFPFRRSLKSLVATYLQRHIQVGHNGHDSFEDARACAELVLWKAACQLRPRHRSEHMP